MKVKPDPYGNDEEFRAYLRQDRIKLILSLAVVIFFVVLTLFLS